MKKWISYIILCLLIPAIIIAGAVLFEEKQFMWIALCVTIASCIPFFMFFEKKESDTKKLLIIAVMVALSVAGRALFAVIPGFKPVTAMVVITAMYFGSEAGFMTGALTAIISNFYFGQGPWTPFQMFVWGFIGLLAGLTAEPLKKNRIVLGAFGVFSGLLFSMLMDILSVILVDGYFNFLRYLAQIISSTPFVVIYAVSNVVFLEILARPIGKVLERIKTKYGL